MRSSRDGQEGIKRIIQDNQELQQLLHDVLEQFARNNFAGLERMLINGFGKYDLIVIKKKSANNKNYLAYYKEEQEIPIAVEESSSDEDKNTFDAEIVIQIEDSSSVSEEDAADIPYDKKVIIQLCRKSPENKKADKILAATKYPWQVDSIFSATIPAQDIPKDRVCLTVMDCYPNNLEKMIQRLRHAHDPEACIAAARNIGHQLSGILKTLKAHDLIWTDMKPGNLLLRDNDQIVIADVKGIVDPAKLNRRKRGNQSLIFGDVSSGFLSSDFKEKRQMSTRDAGEAKGVWEREYSYNLAITLYVLATATKVESIISAGGDEGIYFNFNYRVFQTPAGQRLQYIIAKLGDPNLLDRMHHEDADKLLSLLDDEVEFEREKARVEISILEAKNTSLSVAVRYGTRTPEQALELLRAQHRIEVAQVQLKEIRTSQEKARIEADKNVLKKLRNSGERLAVKIKKISNPEMDISGPMPSSSTDSSSESSSPRPSSREPTPPPVQAVAAKSKKEGRGSFKLGTIQSFLTSPRKKQQDSGTPPAKPSGSKRNSKKK